MKICDKIIPKSLEEVWEWKEKVYEDTKDLSFEEMKKYYKKGLDEAVNILNGKLEKNPDGSCRIVPK